MEHLILKPTTVAKVSKTHPTVTLNTVSGLISVSQAAAEVVETSTMFFVHIDNDRTTYLIPSPEGFEFRNGKHAKGLSLNHSALVRKIIEKNTKPDIELPRSIAFRLGTPSDITVEGKISRAFPLIIIRK